VVNVAVPPDKVPVPIPAPPSENVTVPVGVPDPLLTVAVNVTDAPNDDGFSEEVTLVLVGIPLTTWLSAVEVLGSKVASPWYAAVIECVPETNAEVEREACPAFSVPLPMDVAPSKKITVPVGDPVPVTVAVKVTGCPAVDGLTSEITEMLVGCPCTTWLTAAEMLPEKFASPEYTAVMECEPAVKVAVVNVAWPALKVPLPIVVAPSRNVIVPVGVPAAAVTVAVKVKLWPAVDGFNEEVRVVLVLAPVATFLNRYAVIVPVRGLLPVPVIVEVDSCPSVAKA
jgi:hypothetical protein